MNRLKSVAKACGIVFAISFSIAFTVGALRRSETESWAQVFGLSATLAAALGILIAWRLDEYRRAQVHAAVFERVMHRQSPAVFVDAKGNVIPDDKAPVVLHSLREGYAEFLRRKGVGEDQEGKP